MATVLDLVTEALVTVKALAVGETPGPSMTTDALNKFNEVLEALSIQNLAVYKNTQTTFPLVAGTASYTIGPSGAVVAPRPPFLETAFVTYNGVDFPVVCHTEDEYAALALKNQPGIPEWMIYDPGYPNGTLVLWPVPNVAATMTVYQNAEFTAAATLGDTFAMPPGYRRMVRLLLAWELASDYPSGMSVADLSKLEADSKGAIALVKRNNKKPEMMQSEVAALDCSGGYTGNWRTGQ